MNINTNLYDLGRLYRNEDTNQPDAILSYVPIFTMSNPIYHTVISGETLMDISLKYYGNHNLWFIIAAYNQDKFTDPLELPVGKEFIFPNRDNLETMNYGN